MVNQLHGSSNFQPILQEALFTIDDQPQASVQLDPSGSQYILSNSSQQHYVIAESSPPVILTEGQPQYFLTHPESKQKVVLAAPPVSTWYYQYADGHRSLVSPEDQPRYQVPQFGSKIQISPNPPPPQEVFESCLSPDAQLSMPQQQIFNYPAQQQMQFASFPQLDNNFSVQQQEQDQQLQFDQQVRMNSKTEIPEVNNPADLIALYPNEVRALMHPPQPPPFDHLPTLDGFTSPYEPQPHSLNRNPHFRSYYDVPPQLRNSERPPPDFVLPSMDENGENNRLFAQPPVAMEPFFEPEYGKVLEFQRFRFRVLAQRAEELKDKGFAVHMADLTLYNAQGAKIDLRECGVARCTTGGISDDGEDAQRLLDGETYSRFHRKEFGKYPVDIEVDMGQRVAVSAYSWCTANDATGRDPVSWQFQVLVPHGWATLDTVNDYETPKTRTAIVGPFSLTDSEFGQQATLFQQEYPRQQQQQQQQQQQEEIQQQQQQQSQHDYIPSYYSQQPSQPLPTLVENTVQQYSDQATQYLHQLTAQNDTPDNFELRVEELLRKGADPNYRDSKGRSMFVRSCAKGNPAATDLLIQWNADVNSQAVSGESALHRLALIGDSQSIERALQANADPNLQDRQGDTPLMISAARSDSVAVSLLLRYGARPDLRNGKNLCAIEVLEDECQRQGFITPASLQVRQMLTPETF